MWAGSSLLCCTGGHGRASGEHCRLTNWPCDARHHASSTHASPLPQPLRQPSEGWSQGVLTTRCSCCTPSASIPQGMQKPPDSGNSLGCMAMGSTLLLPWVASSSRSTYMHHSMPGVETAETTCSHTSIAKPLPDARGHPALTWVLCSSSWPCTTLSSSKHWANSTGLLELKQKCTGRSRIYIS